MNWNDWVIDVTHGTEYPCFVPYDGETLVLGMNVISSKCPGNLVGILHTGGQDAANEWEKNNPNWFATFKKEKP